MKNFKKIFSIILILVLSLAMTVGSAACDLSKLEFNIIGGDGQNVENVVPETEGGDTPETPTTDETEDASAFPDYVKFYKYAAEFETAQSTLKLDVKSLEMLSAYIEYVNFYGITKAVEITIKYDANSFEEEYQKAKTAYDESEHIVIGCSVHIGSAGKKGKYYVTSSDGDTIATKTFDKDKEYVSTQVDYSLKMTPPNERAANYDGFKLNSVTKVLKNIKNSEQLRWAIQNGYKPECVVGSSAESVLNNAKVVLRSIVSDEMDDITKLRAIYEWLALNVQYDNYAAQQLQDNPTTLKAYEYDAWYAEGVFDYNKAVCEGYAKALIVMAGLEGIPAIMVTGNNHAWNRVCLGEKWYVVDATHGDVHVNNKEVFSYNQFLITDAEKENRGYPSNDYKDCSATTEFNVFEILKFKYMLQEFDLVVSSKDELEQTLIFARTKKELGKNCTVDVFVNQADAENFENWKNDTTMLTLYKSFIGPESDLNGNVHYIFYLK